MRKLAILGLLAVSFMLLGCGGKSVSRVETGEVIDLSGNWNDTDSRLVSEAMIEDCMSRPWSKDWKKDKSKDPSVIVGTVRNQSHEHINVETFTKDLERAFVNSGKVEVVASGKAKEELRGELKDQAVHSSEETAKSAGEEVGADFMLQGTINTIMDREGGEEVKYYQVNLELVNVETHRKVWIGEKKIKKFVKQSRFGF